MDLTNCNRIIGFHGAGKVFIEAELKLKRKLLLNKKKKKKGIIASTPNQCSREAGDKSFPKLIGQLLETRIKRQNQSLFTEENE